MSESAYSRWYKWHRTWMDDPEWYNNPASQEGFDFVAKYYKGAKEHYDIKKEFWRTQERILKRGGYI